MEVWIGRDGERHGPYSESDVRDWLRTGKVSPDDLGWYQGMTDWKPLSSLFPEEPPALDRAYSPPKAPLQTAPDRQHKPPPQTRTAARGASTCGNSIAACAECYG